MASSNRRSICSAVCRRKVFKPEQLEGGALKRCLNRWDLTALGIGSTLGAGFYVLIGYVALNIAGPSIVLSFLIAAVAALCAGLCYAEFGARVPRAGSAYIYTYVAIGELMAFFIGWCNILEAAVGTASLARGVSMYVDAVCNGSMSTWMASVMPLPSSHVSPYFDLFACSLVLLIGTLLAFGMRASATLNNVLSALNLVIIVFIIITGAFNADPNNWFILSADVPEGGGNGGFFPFGVLGTLRGAALCFYGFVGFDSINAAAEEVQKPIRAIPYTILIVLMTAFLLYTSVAIVLTMMVPYYLQNSMDTVGAAFVLVGWDWAKWFVLVGAVCGILSSLFGALMPLPRLLYAMSADGMFFGCFSKVTTRRSSPVFATVPSAIIIAGVAGLFELEQLITTMCLGTLISYTIVSISVIVLRYRSSYAPKSSPGFFKELFGRGFRLATRGSGRIVYVSLFIFVCICVCSSLLMTQVTNPLIPVLVLHAAVLLLVIIIALQPKAKEEVFFKTPLVPLIPCLSIYVNVHLMVLIKGQTWLRVGIWILIGIPIYVLCKCCWKRKDDIIQDSETVTPYKNKNGKPPVQIIVESPTPPGTTSRFSNYGGEHSIQEVENEIEEENSVRLEPIKSEEITIHQAYVENNEEKEAKIIDLLDQVLQAEEETYSDVISIKDQKEEEVARTIHENDVHRKSVSELSDAGSDASMGNQVLSKYDVIAQVHREDLPKVTEEEERRDDEDITDREIEDYEQVTAFNDSETNSRTDESGYSDTFDRNLLPDTLDDKEDVPVIPVPPPLDENYFRSPNFKKSYTISSRPTKKETENEEENKPRESLQSNSSQGDGNLTFGNDRQINFMSKLNNIFQIKITSNSDDEEPRKRSHSTGNVTEDTDFSISKERPSLFLDLQKEIISREVAQNLRPINTDDSRNTEEEPVEDISLSREDLKSKLENIFATGGPRLLKPRLMKSNPPTPEEAYQTDTSSTESISKLPKMDKNDTLKRQKAKFGEVLNSFRLSFNNDDAV